MIERFITYIVAEKRYSPGTAANYESDLRRFEAFMTGPGDEPFDLRLTTPEDIRRWIARLREEGLQPASVNRMLSSLRSMLRYLRKTGRMDTDPFLRVRSLKTGKRLPAFVPESAMQRLTDEIITEHQDDSFEKRRNRFVVLFFYASGIRLAELRGVNLGDFSDGYRQLRVTGKGDKERVVPVIDALRDEIMRYLEEINYDKICISPDKPLFLSVKGERASRTEIYTAVREVLAGAGVQGKRSPHVLRHTFATHLMNQGADMREIQMLLGHSSLASTQVYTHNSIAQLKETYKNAHPRQGGAKK